MFGWFKKGNPPAKSQDSAPKAKTGKDTPPPSGKPSKDELIAQAMANARAAREAIGEETMGKITEILERQAKKARLEKIRSDLIRKMETDSERMADELKYMLQDKKTDA